MIWASLDGMAAELKVRRPEKKTKRKVSHWDPTDWLSMRVVWLSRPSPLLLAGCLSVPGDVMWILCGLRGCLSGDCNLITRQLACSWILASYKIIKTQGRWDRISSAVQTLRESHRKSIKTINSSFPKITLFSSFWSFSLQFLNFVDLLYNLKLFRRPCFFSIL